ncbi:unnamed protein product [Cuscuta campestris]|uniref:Uncharacterized protein n=1 Tax=Cuscuta campestris TaxID=132261 RepID=A0A484M8A6_9ASTE|nr:unnamed protein product [Cuscuta campestris]
MAMVGSTYVFRDTWEMEKRQVFLRSYHFCRRRGVAEKVKGSLFRVKRVIWVRLRSAASFRRSVWARLRDGLSCCRPRRRRRRRGCLFFCQKTFWRLLYAPRRRAQTIDSADCLFFGRHFTQKGLPGIFLEKTLTNVF